MTALSGRLLVAEPLFTRSPLIALPAGARAGAGRPGGLVLIGPGKGGKARVLRELGRPDVARDVLEALMLERGLWRHFPDRVTDHARSVAARPLEFARRDLTDLPTFTMDPAGAKDYDDAISARREHDGIRAWIHIADVSAYVRPGDAIDAEAYRRGTSVYVPGSVEPMLPHELSSDACSLVPGRERNAVTAEILIRAGHAVSASFYRSSINSDARLTYDQVDRVFAGEERASEPWGEPLELARKLGRTFDERRRAAGALEVNSGEPSFEFNAEGHVVAMALERQTEAHRVIEHLMILANEQVAGYLEDRRLPTLYRIHERPDPVAIESLVARLAALGVPTPPLPERLSSQQAADLVGAVSHAVAAHVKRIGHGGSAYTSLVLRALKMAVYAPGNVGHSGLRSARYCHFTSPIRRYPDLIAHRALLAGLGLDDVAPNAATLADAGLETSAREREATRIERRADDVCRAFMLVRLLGERGGDRGRGESTGAGLGRRPPAPASDADGAFTGEVVGMVGGGLFVAFGPEREFEGFLPLRRLPGYWDMNATETAMVEADSGQTIPLGSELAVYVERVEAARGRVDLMPAGDIGPGGGLGAGDSSGARGRPR